MCLYSEWICLSDRRRPSGASRKDIGSIFMAKSCSSRTWKGSYGKKHTVS